jgi:hypothetical protein
MRCSVLIGLAFLLIAPVWADEAPAGSVTGPNKTMSGTWLARLTSGVASVRTRDVFHIVRGQKVLGEAMVMSVGAQGVMVVPKAGFSGSPQAGDRLVFVRHAAAVPQDAPHVYMPPSAAEQQRAEQQQQAMQPPGQRPPPQQPEMNPASHDTGSAIGTPGMDMSNGGMSMSQPFNNGPGTTAGHYGYYDGPAGQNATPGEVSAYATPAAPSSAPGGPTAMPSSGGEAAATEPTAPAAAARAQALTPATGPVLQIFAVEVAQDVTHNGAVRVRGQVRNISGRPLTHVSVTFVLWDEGALTEVSRLTGDTVARGSGYSSYDSVVGALQAGETRTFEVLTSVVSTHHIDTATKIIAVEVSTGDFTHPAAVRPLHYGFKAETAEY